MIGFKFDWVDNFKNGLAKVKSLKKLGMINKKGEFVLPCEYDLIGDFKDDLGMDGLPTSKVLTLNFLRVSWMGCQVVCANS